MERLESEDGKLLCSRRTVTVRIHVRSGQLYGVLLLRGLAFFISCSINSGISNFRPIVLLI